MLKKLFALSCLALAAAGSNAQTISTFAGNGTAGYAGDNVAATSTSLSTPYGVAVDGMGNVYIADYGNNRIRKVDGTTGIITTIAGTGVSGYSGDNGPATAAQLQGPRGITVDPFGNVVFSDYANNRIRKINMTTGVITTIAGVGGSPTYVASDDGGPATAARLGFAWGVTYDSDGNLYIADNQNCRIRKVGPTGIITTIAGNGNCFVSGDGGQATDARIQYPTGVAIDGAYNLIIADDGNNRIRKVTPSGIITTLAGSAVYGFTGDGGPSTAAKLYLPRAVAADGPGNIYICDMNNNRLRKINIFGTINTLAGNGTMGFGGDGGVPTLASLNQPTGVAVDQARGKYYICDNDNNRIRVINTFHTPYFTQGDRQTFSVCETATKNLDTMLAVDDIDVGQTETWTLLTAPLHGAASVAYVTSSTGFTNIPLGLNYTATTGYSGPDSFKVRVFDGTYSDTTTIVVNIVALNPDPGVISGTDSVCPRFTVNLASTVSGGTWSSSNNAIATVNGSGVVTGVAPGLDTIYYSVSNMCNTSIAMYEVKVRDTSVCPGVGISTLTSNGELMTVFPNPNTGSFQVSINSPSREETNFVITNALGTKVKRFKGYTNSPIEVNLYELPAGVYTLSATNQQRHYTQQIVISK